MIYDILKESAANYTPQGAKEINKFANRLKQYTSCPYTVKEFARMESFSAIPEVVQAVLDMLKVYDLPSDNLRLITFNGNKEMFDDVGFWYCIALLSYTDNEECHKFLFDLTDKMIGMKYRGLTLLRRNFWHFERDIYTENINKIKEYFNELNKVSPAYALAKEIGLSIPEDDTPWGVFVTLTNYDKSGNIIQAPGCEMDKHYYIEFSFFAPRGDGECFNLDFQDYNHNVYMTCVKNSSPYYMTITKGNEKIYEFTDANDPMKIKDTIATIEKVLNIKFNRKMYSCDTPVKENKKLIQAWLLKD